MNPETILISAYNYQLPTKRIAYHPLENRDASKLLVYKSGSIEEDTFFNLPSHIPNDSLLVLNNTKVIEARLLFKKESGGVIEIFCLEPHLQNMEAALQQTESSQWKCLVGGASKWKHGQVLKKQLFIGGKPVELTALYQAKLPDGFIIQFDWNSPEIHFIELLHAAGAMPLPPYIKRGSEAIDAERYQTIFGKVEGSVAAPTAALHFTEEVFEKLKEKQIARAIVTLNVGAGTFKPVKAENITDHVMHGEDFTITKKLLEDIIAAKKIIAVGTTSLRTLESIHWLGVKLISGILNKGWIIDQWEVYRLDNTIDYKNSLAALISWMDEHTVNELHGRTSLLIAPGYHFKVPCGLITNFHQPQSTLLLLIAAFIGDDWKKVYDYAMNNSFRFLSYGDSSLLWKNDNETWWEK